MDAGEAHQALIRGLYAALARRDGEAMAACYAPDARFRDPVFDLQGGDIGDMWRMLTARATDLDAECFDVDADAGRGSASWVARYTFSTTGRPVVNRIRARYRFADGRIVEHLDTFDLWRWASQALGPVGLLLGWAPPVRAKIRRQALAGLRAFQKQGMGSRE